MTTPQEANDTGESDSPQREFPTHLLMHREMRSGELVQEFYETHHAEQRDILKAKDAEKKLRFFLRKLREHGAENSIKLAVDLGCRGGSMTRQLIPKGAWVGVDLDRKAVELARTQGIPCIELNIMSAIDFADESFDAVCLTEVLEHLPYPTITLYEVWRILRKDGNGIFFGSVPLDYYYKNRLRALTGKPIITDPTHLRSFSFVIIKDLLERYFEQVEFFAVRGSKVRHSWLPSNLFIKNVAWFASRPRRKPLSSRS